MRAILMALPLLLAACGTAAEPFQNEAAHNGHAMAQEGQTEAMRAYAAANDRMHAAMGRIDRDPDVAFVQGMIPHHQGAIDMAEIVLKHGKDPETRKLAGEIIAAQRAEIAQMRAWLEKRGAGTTAGKGANPHAGH
jgi:uncharacterized protein (DUF305 family)